MIKVSIERPLHRNVWCDVPVLMLLITLVAPSQGGTAHAHGAIPLSLKRDDHHGHDHSDHDHDGHTCIHKEIWEHFHPNGTFQVIPQPGELPNLHRFEVRQSATMSPIRIVVSTADLDDSTKYCTAAGDVRPTFTGSQTMTCSSTDVFTAAKKAKLINDLLPSALNFLMSALKVVPLTAPLTVGKTTVCGSQVTVPAAHVSPGVSNADFVLYVTAGPITSATTAAWASSCAYSSSKRPIVGQANFNPSQLDAPKPASYSTKIATHEIMHALGFSDSFAKSNFLAPNTVPIQTVTVRGKTTTAVVTPEVLARAKEYFNCPTVTFLELEDQGGSGTAGSHWDKRILFNEVMVGYFRGGEVSRSISKMTLAFFKDSGHYDVDYTKSDESELWYGRDQGCGFITEKCNTDAAGKDKFFCWTADAAGCTNDRLAIAFCDLATYTTDLPTQFQYVASNTKQGGQVSYMDYCPFWEGWGNQVCSNAAQQPLRSDADILQANNFGDNGRCMETTDADGTVTYGGLRKQSNSYYPGGGQRCFLVRCPNGNRVEVQVGDSTVWLQCPLDGSAGTVTAPTGYVGKIKCPTASSICTPALYYGSSTPTPPTPAPPTPVPVTPSPPTPVPVTPTPVTPSPPTPAPPTTTQPPITFAPPPTPSATTQPPVTPAPPVTTQPPITFAPPPTPSNTITQAPFTLPPTTFPPPTNFPSNLLTLPPSTNPSFTTFPPQSTLPAGSTLPPFTTFPNSASPSGGPSSNPITFTPQPSSPNFFTTFPPQSSTLPVPSTVPTLSPTSAPVTLFCSGRAQADCAGTCSWTGSSCVAPQTILEIVFTVKGDVSTFDSAKFASVLATSMGMRQDLVRVAFTRAASVVVGIQFNASASSTTEVKQALYKVLADPSSALMQTYGDVSMGGSIVATTSPSTSSGTPAPTADPCASSLAFAFQVLPECEYLTNPSAALGMSDADRQFSICQVCYKKLPLQISVYTPLTTCGLTGVQYINKLNSLCATTPAPTAAGANNTVAICENNFQQTVIKNSQCVLVTPLITTSIQVTNPDDWTQLCGSSGCMPDLRRLPSCSNRTAGWMKTLEAVCANPVVVRSQLDQCRDIVASLATSCGGNGTIESFMGPNANLDTVPKVCPACLAMYIGIQKSLFEKCQSVFPDARRAWEWTTYIPVICSTFVEKTTLVSTTTTYCWGPVRSATTCTNCVKAVVSAAQDTYSMASKVVAQWPFANMTDSFTRLCTAATNVNGVSCANTNVSLANPDFDRVCTDACSMAVATSLVNKSIRMYAGLLRAACAKGANGYCGKSTWTRGLAIINAGCDIVDVTKSNTCSSNCKTLIGAFIADAGCCINSFQDGYMGAAQTKDEYTASSDAFKSILTLCSLTSGCTSSSSTPAPTLGTARMNVWTGRVVLSGVPIAKLQDSIKLYVLKATTDIAGQLGVAESTVQGVDITSLGADVVVTFAVVTDNVTISAFSKSTYDGLQTNGGVKLITTIATVTAQTGVDVSTSVTVTKPKNTDQEALLNRTDTDTCSSIISSFMTACSGLDSVFTSPTTDALQKACAGSCPSVAKALLDNSDALARVRKECGINTIARIASYADVLCERDGSDYCLITESDVKTQVLSKIDSGDDVTVATLTRVCKPCLWRIVRARDRYNARLASLGLVVSNSDAKRAKTIMNNLCTKNGDTWCFPTTRSLLVAGTIPLNSSLCTDVCLSRTAAALADGDVGLQGVVRAYCIKSGAALCGDSITSIKANCDPSKILTNANFCTECTNIITTFQPSCCWGHLVRNAIESGLFTEADYTSKLSSCSLTSPIPSACTSSTTPSTNAYKFTARVAFKATVSFVQNNLAKVIGAGKADIALQLGLSEQDITSATVQYGLQTLLVMTIQSSSNDRTAAAETALNALLSNNALALPTLLNLFASDKSNEGGKLVVDAKSSQTASASTSSATACDQAFTTVKTACAGYENYLTNTTSSALRDFCSKGCSAVAKQQLDTVQSKCNSDAVEVVSLLADMMCTEDSGQMCYAEVRSTLSAIRVAIQNGDTVTTSQLDVVCSGSCARVLQRSRTQFAARLARFGVNVNTDADQAMEAVLLQGMCLKEDNSYCFPRLASKLQSVDKFFTSITINDVCDTSSLCVSRFVKLTSAILGGQDQPKNSSAILKAQCATNNGQRCGTLYASAPAFPDECSPRTLKDSCPLQCQTAFQARIQALGCCYRNLVDAEADNEGSYTATQAYIQTVKTVLTACNITLPDRCGMRYTSDRVASNLSVNANFAWCQADLDKCKQSLIADFAAASGLTVDNFLDFTVRNGSIVSSFTVATESQALTQKAGSVLSTTDNVQFNTLQTTYSADTGGSTIAVTAQTVAPTATPTSTPAATPVPISTNSPATTTTQSPPSQLTPTPITPSPPQVTPAPVTTDTSTPSPPSPGFNLFGNNAFAHTLNVLIVGVLMVCIL